MQYLYFSQQVILLTSLVMRAQVVYYQHYGHEVGAMG